ncbi:uncharacterized protein DDB_G0283697 [Silurus meridionalis]|uniref:Uncharacterized protein n=1 Tax=Silurus meridionalis TaxID=175797 RepID=A0A8T0BHE4_SILME|nr:uncharacterized protein DDB_G0283697 [Silurus meridionalis]KAF7704936.1 hypothetical protein HF521_020222 [Silurus meridionalis]
MSSTPLAVTEEDVFDLTDAVPETERLDSSLQKAKAQLSTKTRRHRPSRSRLRDSLSSTEGEESLDGKSYTGLLSGSCSPLLVSLRCPSPFQELHSSSSPARKDRTFTFETDEGEKKDLRRRSACLLYPSSPTHLLKGDNPHLRQEDHTNKRYLLLQCQEDSPQLYQENHVKQRHQENSHLHMDHRNFHKNDHTDLHQEDHKTLHQRHHTHLRQGDHTQLNQEDHIHLHQRDFTDLHQRDFTDLHQSNPHKKDHTYLHKRDHFQEDNTHLRKRDHLQEDNTHLRKRDHLHEDDTHLRKRDHLQEDNTHLRKRDHLQEDDTHLRKRDHLREDSTNVHEKSQVQLHDETHSTLRQRDYSQSEDDSRDVGSDEPSSPTVLLDKKTRRRFLDLGVTLRRTYGKVRRDRANRHTTEDRGADGAQSRSSRSSGPPFVAFSWLSERIRGSSSLRNPSQSQAKIPSEDEEVKNDSRSSRNGSSQPYLSLSDHSHEGRDEHTEPRGVRKKINVPFSSSERDGTEKQNGIHRDKRDDGHEGNDGDAEKLLTS